MLTPDIEGQKYVLVYALHAGSFYLPDKEVFEDSLEAKTGSQVPSFAFLIEHDVHGRLMFDLGLRKHGQGYPPAWEETLQEFTVDCPRDVVDLLEEDGVSPSSIRTVVYSHLHFDHVGDLAPFTSAEIVLGGEAAELMEDTYPRNPDSLWQELPAGRKVCYIDFETDQRGLSPLGSFNRAVDFFRDGSLYLLDAPGHFPGHLAVLARVSTNKLVLLAADCCHNRLCYNPGHRLISRENYHDVQVARDTVQRLKIMDRTEGVLVILAHERERLDEMPLFPNSLNHWAQTQIGKKTNAS